MENRYPDAFILQNNMMEREEKMKRLEKIINDERNMGLNFIVHIQNKNELKDLIEVLTKLEFEIQLSLKEQTLKKMDGRIS